MSNYDSTNNPYGAPPDFEYEKKPQRPGNAIGCLSAMFGGLTLLGFTTFLVRLNAENFHDAASLWITPVALLGLGLGFYSLRTDERLFGCLGIFLSLISLAIGALWIFL